MKLKSERYLVSVCKQGASCVGFVSLQMNTGFVGHRFGAKRLESAQRAMESELLQRIGAFMASYRLTADVLADGSCRCLRNRFPILCDTL